MTDKIDGGAEEVCESFRLTRLSRDVLELAFMHLPTLDMAKPRHSDAQVTEALVRCAAVIGSIAVSKLIGTFEDEEPADALLTARDEG